MGIGGVVVRPLARPSGSSNATPRPVGPCRYASTGASCAPASRFCISIRGLAPNLERACTLLLWFLVFGGRTRQHAPHTSSSRPGSPLNSPRFLGRGSARPAIYFVHVGYSAPHIGDPGDGKRAPRDPRTSRCRHRNLRSGSR